MIPMFLVNKFGPQLAKVVFFGTILAVLLLVVGGIYLAGRHAGKSGQQLQDAKAQVKVQGQIGAANENASAARVADTSKQDQQKQEITDAVRDAKSPDDARVRRGCVILRQQGVDTTRLAQCAGR